METKVLKELDLPEYIQPLDTAIKFLDNLSYSAVKTKYNAKGDWDAVSIKGYSDDIGNILKPGVLKSDVEPAELRWTSLYEEPDLLPLKEILSHIPAEFERVRVMRLKAGTTIKKHTDKVDKEIKEGLADLAHKVEQDHEIQLARGELYKAAKYSIKLHDIMKTMSEEEGLDGWVSAKITKVIKLFWLRLSTSLQNFI